MNAYKPIQEAFKRLNKSTVEWFKYARFPKTAETANAILYRDAVVDASTLAYMACCLDMPNTAIINILDTYAIEQPKKANEVSILKRLIAPIDLSLVEQELIESMRKLTESKRQLVFDMVGGLLK